MWLSKYLKNKQLFLLNKIFLNHLTDLNQLVKNLTVNFSKNNTYYLNLFNNNVNQYLK